MAKGKIIFLHPDLGVGGAERLVVDAALSLKSSGYDVSFVTSHHDENHCFEDTKNGTLPVKVVGDFLPRHIFGKFYALCAYIRMIVCAMYIVLFREADLVFCDLISACIPFLRLKINKIIFYCHFPDQLLSLKTGFIKDVYRRPINWFEERTTRMADKLFVNSNFTKSVFNITFPSISTEPDVLYPSINIEPFNKIPQSYDLFCDFIKEYGLSEKSFVLLSINRYERKKNIELSMKALKELKGLLSESDWNLTSLIVAGGYDSRVTENVEYYEELRKVSEDLGISNKVIFLKSPSDDEKIRLLKNCHCLIYTPSNEHFGIVPLEAMYCSKPVIAVNNGGPTETVLTDETGFLCEPDPVQFSKAIANLISDKNLRESMGNKGKARFMEMFSFKAFSEKLNSTVSDMLKTD